MDRTIAAYKLSHWIIRLIVVANVLRFGLALLSVHLPLVKLTPLWQLDISYVVLPSYLALEFWFMREARAELRALLIDGAFVISWFLIRALFTIFLFTHYAP